MFLRNRFGITAALVCHLVLALPVVTSQLLPGNSGAQSDTRHPAESTLPVIPPHPGEDVTIKAAEQEKTGSLYRLRGNVEIDFRTLVFHGDEATYDASSGEITATGPSGCRME